MGHLPRQVTGHQGTATVGEHVEKVGRRRGGGGGEERRERGAGGVKWEGEGRGCEFPKSVCVDLYCVVIRTVHLAIYTHVCS